jgi:hypothetical protein
VKALQEEEKEKGRRRRRVGEGGGEENGILKGDRMAQSVTTILHFISVGSKQP